MPPENEPPLTLGTDTDLSPPALVAEIPVAAEDQYRPAPNVVQEALEPSSKEARAAPYRRVVFATKALSDAELAAITEGDMDPRHNHLSVELE